MPVPTDAWPLKPITPIPRVVTDPATVEQRAREWAHDTARFRSWLRFRSQVSNEEVDELVRAAADAVWRQVDCEACGACCRVLSVSVDDYDIARLARRSGLSPGVFARRYVAGQGSKRCLRARPCPFLHGNRCSVYEERPRACRDFPYLHAPGFRGRVLLLIEYSFFCPVVLNTLQVVKRRLPWREKPRPRRTAGRIAVPLQKDTVSADISMEGALAAHSGASDPGTFQRVPAPARRKAATPG